MIHKSNSGVNILKIFIYMSLFPSIFGCSGSGKKPNEFANVPQFPLTDNPVCKVNPIRPENDFFGQAFILSRDKKNVFLLAYGMAGTPENMPYQVLRLNADGIIEDTITMEHCKWTEYPNFW